MPGPSAPRPEALPAASVVIEINRETGRVVAHDVEIYVPTGHAIDPDLPQQVRWVVRSGLLPDELVIVFGKPLDWAGAAAADGIRQVENVFECPFTLGRTTPERASGPCRIEVPDTEPVLAWPYGIVVLRGNDRPLTASPRVLIHPVA